MVFGNRTLLLHVAKGLGGFGALGIALATMNATIAPSLVLLPLSLYLLRGCRDHRHENSSAARAGNFLSARRQMRRIVTNRRRT